MEAFRKYCLFVLVSGILGNPVWASNSSNYTKASQDDSVLVSNSNHESFYRNTRWALDFSTRRIRNLDQGEWYSQDVYGFDLHKVFTGASGDIGTLVFQPYIVHLKNIPNPPFFFDDGDDWQLTWRIANFNYTGLAKGKFNIRVGHFEIPFGLEQNIDTNGTLRQYTFSNRGVKADWGLSLNGKLPEYDYEFAITRGSSNEYLDRDNPYVVSGRIGTPSHNNTIFGFSYFYGEVLAGDETIKRKHLGLDISHYFKQWEFLNEISGGENVDNEVLNWLSEVSWRNLPESLHLYIQAKSSLTKIEDTWKDAFNTSIGLDWKLTRDFSIGTQVNHQFDSTVGENADTTAQFQLRLRI